MSEGDGAIHLDILDGVAAIRFDRPQARNAMTWAMYDRLAEIAAEIGADESVRVATLRGTDGNFAAGTDIAQFTGFATAEDGVAYEAHMERVIGAVEALRVPTIAIVEGAAMGGGMLLASVCDIRIATPDARMGMPIARTLGNCLTVANMARLVATLGAGRAKRMLLLAEPITAEEAADIGFIAHVVAPGMIEETVAGLCERLRGNAPLTMRVAKESVRRIKNAGLADGEDLVRSIYGSEDFKTGVRAFLDKQKPRWQGK